jgi:PhnB protein
MDGVSLEAYVFFDGNCREAMEFYKGVFGGELKVQTYGEAPGDSPADMKDKVMHASLEGRVKLMASDKHGSEDLGTGKISLSLVGKDEAALTEMFNALAEGGKVTSPLKKEFWGDTFGMLTDKYSVDWMFNISAAQDQQ